MNEEIKDLEKAIIGALIVQPESYYLINHRITLDHFQMPVSKDVYSAISDMHKKSIPVDLLTVSEQLLKCNSKTTAYDVVQCTNIVGSTANIEYHATILHQHWMRRRAKVISLQMSKMCDDTSKDEFEIFDTATQLFQDVQNFTFSGMSATKQDIATQMLDYTERIRSGEGGFDLFGIPELHNMIGGCDEGDMIIIAGRPGMGKSSLLNAAIVHHIKLGIPALFWSSEMTAKNTTQRIVSALSGVSFERMIAPDRTESEFTKVQQALDQFIESPVIIEDRAGVTVNDFKSRVTALVKSDGIRSAWYDRIGLFNDLGRVKNDNKASRLAETTKVMRQMSNNLKIPIIGISQLSRAVESRHDKRPQLSDLRDSGAIEQDATKVLLLYRPEYYRIEYEGDPRIGEGEIICAKNTNGKTGSVWVNFSGDRTIFYSDGDGEVLPFGKIETRNIDANIPF